VRQRGPACRPVLLGPRRGRAGRRVRRGDPGVPARRVRRRGGRLMDLDQLIKSTLDERELAYEHPQPGRFFVTLPGTKKLRTNCWLILGDHGLAVEAFVCRRPDEAQPDVYRFLLRRNAKLYGVSYTLDAAGDIYLIGRV